MSPCSGYRTMLKSPLPAAAVAARLPSRVDLALVTPCAEPPVGDGWLHELKHDGHRLVAIFDGRGALRLLSRNGFDRTARFRAPFDAMLGRIRRRTGHRRRDRRPR